MVVALHLPKSTTTRFNLILVLFFLLHLLSMEMGDSQTNNNNNSRFCCRICDREFTSGQALGGHVRAHYAVNGRQRLYDLRSCVRSGRRCEINGDCSTEEEEDMANCLVMLSAAAEEEEEEGGKEVVVVGGEEKSCGSTATEENQRVTPPDPPVPPATPSGVFECKGCKKVFTSHQALGGHRASHKKVKGCFATTDKSLATKEDSPVTTNTMVLEKKKGKALYKANTHECTVCSRVFSSGQALGGHKRCHWLTGNLTDTTSSADIHQCLHLISPMFEFPEKLHLNLPATPSPADIDGHSILHMPSLERIDRITDLDLNNNEIIKNKDCINKRKRINRISEDLEDGEDEKKEKGKLKLTKLTEVNDLKMEGHCSSWLQVGIGSFSEANGTSQS